MNISKVMSKDAVATIRHFIESKEHGIAYCVHDEKSVFIPNPDAVDRDICKKLGYMVLETGHTGGVVVVSKGDMSVVHFGDIGGEFMKDFALYLVNRCREKGLNATYDGNDVLVDGYKIGGVSATPYGHIQYSTIHVGINTNLDDIKPICTKPMVKVPRGLSEYGITVEEVETWFLTFLESGEWTEVTA